MKVMSLARWEVVVPCLNTSKKKEACFRASFFWNKRDDFWYVPVKNRKIP